MLVLSLLQVIGRIFYSVDKSWKGRINISDLRNSTLLQVSGQWMDGCIFFYKIVIIINITVLILCYSHQDISQLEQEEDINKFTDFFSYEHFYVIYCKFWELDTDHDLLIDAQDLIRHSDHGKQEHNSFYTLKYGHVHVTMYM